jgi:hypothetical protein
MIKLILKHYDTLPKNLKEKPIHKNKPIKNTIVQINNLKPKNKIGIT